MRRHLLLATSIAAALLATSAAQAQPAVRMPFSSAAAAFTRPNNTSCCTASQLIGNSATAGSVTPMQFDVGRTVGALWGAKVKSSNTGLAGSTVTLRLYTALPTVASGDGAAFSTNDAGWLCDIVIPFNGLSFTDGTSGYGIPATAPACPVPANTPTLYGLAMANGTFTAAASATWTFTLYGQ